jgi:hypothetical protein
VINGEKSEKKKKMMKRMFGIPPSLAFLNFEDFSVPRQMALVRSLSLSLSHI